MDLTDNPFRVGFGYDAHRLVEGRDLILGGIKIPYERGLLGHSDADVLTHAIIDAILGALSRGDIGQHFPDTDPKYKGADSLHLLEKTMMWMREDGFGISNVDSTIVAEQPKLAPYIMAMRERLSQSMGIHRDLVNVKAKTTEKMGFCGRGEGMAAYAVVSLMRAEL